MRYVAKLMKPREKIWDKKLRNNRRQAKCRLYIMFLMRIYPMAKTRRWPYHPEDLILEDGAHVLVKRLR